VHNAGVMPAPWHETSDGHERTMQVNVLGPVLLTRLLFPFLRGERFADKGNDVARLLARRVRHLGGALLFVQRRRASLS
jgi:NAD(P)-dependent dehydrogenase (short-subunit alcohol dehydrogenase family)